MTLMIYIYKNKTKFWIQNKNEAKNLNKILK